MIRRILFTILGAMLCFFTAPAAMAGEAAPEGILAPLNISQASNSKHADFFVAAPEQGEACSGFLADSSDDEAIGADDSSDYEFGGEDGRRAAAAFGDLGLAEFPECGEESESSVESESEAKRTQKRAASQKISTSKCRVLECLSAKSLSKGVAKHPATQDAGQERTAAIRFLQLQALDCQIAGRA